MLRLNILKLNVIVFLFLFTSTSFAQTSGNGCRIDDKVYTEYLGQAYPYGPGTDIKRYYKNTQYIPIYYGYGYNQHQGYKCGYINIYPSSSYWNGSSNVPIPAENEITSSSNNSCVIAATLGAAPIRNGDYVRYTYNKPSKCAANPPENVPLDNYVFVILGLSAVMGWKLIKDRTIRFS